MMQTKRTAFVLGDLSHDLQLAMHTILSAKGWEVKLTPNAGSIDASAKLQGDSVIFAFVDGPLLWDDIKRIHAHAPLVALGKHPGVHGHSHARPKNWEDWFEAWIDPNDGLELLERAAIKALARYQQALEREAA